MSEKKFGRNSLSPINSHQIRKQTGLGGEGKARENAETAAEVEGANNTSNNFESSRATFENAAGAACSSSRENVDFSTTCSASWIQLYEFYMI